jgi:hypothetical protein
MRRILIGLTTGALCALGLVGTAGTADAREPGHHDGRSHHVVRSHPYYRDHGHRFSGGYYYSGHDHPHWGRRVWDVTYRRWNYWDPYLSVWYYWCAPAGCWYPVTYCP